MTDEQRSIYEGAIAAGLSINAAYELAFPKNNNKTNQGTTYLSSQTKNQNLHYIWKSEQGLSFEASASMAKYKNNPITPYASNPYIITGSVNIPANVALFLTASWADVNFVSSISASIATGSIAKIGVPKSYFSEYVSNNVDTQKFKVWAGNLTGSVGLEEFNVVSSSTTGNYVVLYASGSRATMGSVVTNGFMVSLGTTQLNNRTQ